MHCLLRNRLIILTAFFSICMAVRAMETHNVAATVTLTQVKAGTLNETLEVYGKTVPRKDISVTTNLDGIHVLDVFIDEGEYVTQGQTLARLDKEALQYSLDSLLAELNKAEQAFSRAKTLRKTAAISQEDVDIKQTEYLTLQAQVSDARLRLQRTNVVAPAAGIVYQRNIIVGQITRTDEPLFKIAADAAIELEVTVPEKFAAHITLDTQVEASLIDDNNKRPAPIRYISPRIDGSTRTAKIRLHFPSRTFIPVNMFCSARFTLPGKNGLTIENTALQRDQRGDFVWVVKDDDSVMRRDVNIVARYGNESLITGIEENQNVVARAGAFLQEGDRIQRAKKGSW